MGGNRGRKGNGAGAASGPKDGAQATKGPGKRASAAKAKAKAKAGGPAAPGGDKAAGADVAQDSTTRTHASEFGEAVWLMSRDPIHKLLRVQDLEWFAMTPILLRQYRIFRAGVSPIGVAFWAYLSEAVEKRITGPDASRRLDPKEWRSGDRLWLVTLVAPFGHQDVMLDDLKKSVFKDKAFKFQRRGADGTEEVVEG